MSRLPFRKSLLLTAIFLSSYLTNEQIAMAMPTITNIDIRNTGYTSVTIAWRTDIPTNSQINYGETSADAYKSPTSTEYDVDHSVTLTNLRPATQYQFKIVSTDETGASVSSNVQQFSTLSFTFEDDKGTFATINATPTPTPYVNPYAPYIPQQNTQQFYPGYQQPLYIVPPVVYQQPVSGQTLGEATAQVPTATPIPASTLEPILQSGIWGVIILLAVLVVILVLLLNQIFKNKRELDEIQRELHEVKRLEKTLIHKEEPEKSKKVYRFDVRS